MSALRNSEVEARRRSHQTHRLVADVDATFEQNVFNLAQRKRIADVHHHSEANDLGRCLEVIERSFHSETLDAILPTLNAVSSDNAPRTNPGDREKYVRKNGPFTLVMFAGANQKLPFGNLPRLMLAWISTEAVQTQSRELVLGDSLSEFMRSLGIYSNSGRVHIRLRNQMERLFQCHVQLIHEQEHGKRFVSSQIADQGEFWWSERRPDERSLWQSKIELGEKFFNEIILNPVPLDMNILKALKQSPLGLDLYMCLTYRTFNLDGPKRLSWPMLYRQFEADPSRGSDRVTVDNFRKDCLRELKKIQTAWPGLEYRIERGRRHEKTGGLLLLPSAPAIPPLKLVT